MRLEPICDVERRAVGERVMFSLSACPVTHSYRLEVLLQPEQLLYGAEVTEVELQTGSFTMGDLFFARLSAITQLRSEPTRLRRVLGYYLWAHEQLFGRAPSARVLRHHLARHAWHAKERFEPTSACHYRRRPGDRVEPTMTPSSLDARGAPRPPIIPPDRDPFLGFNCAGEVRAPPDDRPARPAPLAAPNRRLPKYRPS